MFEEFREAIFYEINVIDDYEQRRKAIRLMIDILVEEYGKTRLREENDKHVSEFIEKYKQATEPRRIEFPHWLRPLRTVSEIASMEPSEGWKYQYIYRLKDKTAWLASDDRFFDGGRIMRFYKAAKARRKTLKDDEFKLFG